MKLLSVYLSLSLAFVGVANPPNSCGSYTREAIECVFASSAWKIESVTSDILRVQNGQASLDWSTFCPEESAYVELHGAADLFQPRQDLNSLTAYLQEQKLETVFPAGDTILMSLDARSGIPICQIETTDFLRSAKVACPNEYTQYVYGHRMLTELGQAAGMEFERWYNIKYSYGEFSYQVEKQIDGESFEVTVILRRSI